MLAKQTKSVFSRISHFHNAYLTRYASTIPQKHQIAEYDAELVVDCENKLGECPMYVGLHPTMQYVFCYIYSIRECLIRY